MVNGKSALLFRQQGKTNGQTGMSVLPHFEQIDPHKFPVAVVARKNVERSTCLFLAQFLCLETDVGGEQIRVPLFSTQNFCAPDFRLSAHHPTNKSDQFSRDHARLQLNLLTADNRLVQLSDETTNRWIHLYCVGSRFSPDASVSRGQR